MNIDTRKINLVQQIFMIQKESILDKMENLLNQEASSLSPIQKEAIDAGIQSLDSGKGIPHHEVMKETKLRYPNLFK